MGQFPNDYSERSLTNLDGEEKIFLDDSGTSWVKLNTIRDSINLVVTSDYTGGFTLALTDMGKRKRSIGTTDHNVTIPNNSSVAFPIGTVVVFRVGGIGLPTFVAASGVTLNGGTMAFTTQYQEGYVIKVGTNEWDVLIGGAGSGSPDVTAPTLLTATVEDANPDKIVLTYDETLDSGSVPAGGDFVAALGRTVTTVGIAGAVVTLTVNTPYAFGDTITLDYTPGANPIQDISGNDAAALSSQAVDNNVSSGSGYDADADTYFIAVAAAGGTLSTTQKDEYNDWVVAEKAASRYTKYTAIYPFMGGTAASHAINAADPGTFDITWNGSQTHDANGVRCGGTTADYGSTGIVPLTVLSQDSLHISIYINDDNDSSGYDIGTYSTSAITLARISGDAYTNCSALGDATTTATDIEGMNVVTRTVNTEYHYVKNGTDNTKTNTSTAAPNTTITIGIDGLLLSAPSTRRYGFSTIGSGLTVLESQGMSTNTTTLQTNIGRP